MVYHEMRLGLAVGLAALVVTGCSTNSDNAPTPKVTAEALESAGSAPPQVKSTISSPVAGQPSSSPETARGQAKVAFAPEVEEQKLEPKGEDWTTPSGPPAEKAEGPSFRKSYASEIERFGVYIIVERPNQDSGTSELLALKNISPDSMRDFVGDKFRGAGITVYASAEEAAGAVQLKRPALQVNVFPAVLVVGQLSFYSITIDVNQFVIVSGYEKLCLGNYLHLDPFSGAASMDVLEEVFYGSLSEACDAFITEVKFAPEANPRKSITLMEFIEKNQPPVLDVDQYLPRVAKEGVGLLKPRIIGDRKDVQEIEQMGLGADALEKMIREALEGAGYRILSQRDWQEGATRGGPGFAIQPEFEIRYFGSNPVGKYGILAQLNFIQKVRFPPGHRCRGFLRVEAAEIFH